LAVRTESVGVQRIRKENSVFVASNSEELQNLSVTHIPFDATDARAAGTLPKNRRINILSWSINLRPFRGLARTFFVADLQMNLSIW
jgi:hypothetical protein